MDAADALPVAAAPPVRKIDDVNTDDAEMLQPAAPTLEVSAPPPSEPAAADITKDREAVAAALDEQRVAADDSWLQDSEADASALQRDDSCTATTKSASNGRLQSQPPERGAEVESLVSLPSPTANSAPQFDAFATSPVKAQQPMNTTSPKLLDEPTAAVSVSDQKNTTADPLAHVMSGLNLDAGVTAEAPVDKAPVLADDNDERAMDPADGGELEAVDPHGGAEELQHATHSPGSQTSETAVEDTANSADDVDVDEAADSLDDQPAPAALSIPLVFGDTAPISALPVTNEHESEDLDTSQGDGAHSPPTPTPASAPAPVMKAVPDDKVVAPSASQPRAKASPSRPTKGPNAQPGSKSSDAVGAAAAEAKLKNGRVLHHPPPAAARAKASDSTKSRSGEPVKVKAGDSMKVIAPPTSKASLIKTKAKGDDETPSSSATAVKTAPLKPKPHRTGGSSSSSTQDRVAKSTSKSSPTPKTTTAPAAPAPSKQAQDSTSPPPAPTSTEESDGIKSLKKRLSSSELEAAANRLYSDAIESKKRKEIRKTELEEKYSFAPQVNAKKRPSVPDEKNRFVALHEKAIEAMKRKEELRQKREKAECTFKPKITAKARKLSMATKTTKPRFENLYQQAQEIQLKRDVKKSESEQKAVDECSFKPKIKATKSPAKSRPLYDAERLKQRKLALEQKKIETELSQCTFKPKVVAKAAKVKGDEAGGKAGGDAKLFDRLYQASQKKAENLEKLRHEREAQEKLVATFHPKLTAAAAAKAENKQPFHERLYNKDHMQKVTAERELKKLEEEQKFTFKPQLTPVPDEIKAKHGSPSSSPDKSIFERLYEEKDKLKDKIEAGDMIRKQKEMDGCTFRPQLEMGPNRATDQPSAPIWERLLSYDKSQVLEEREKQRHQLEMQDCTFKPEVTPSEFFTPKKSPSVGIFDRLTGGAVSMPASDMKQRESERKAPSATHSKRRSVPELEGFKNCQQPAESGTALRSPNIDESADTSPDNDANQPRSLPPSLQSSELKNRDHSKRDDAAAPRATSGMENAMSSSDPTGDCCSSGRVNHAENNPSESPFDPESVGS